MQIVYTLTNEITKKQLVGSSIQKLRRRHEHFSMLRRGCHDNPLLQAAWDRYGPDVWTFEIIEEINNSDVPFRLTREQFWVDKLNTLIPNGYNICPDTRSRKGAKWSDKSRRRQSRLLKILGIKPPPEASLKAAEKTRGVPRTDEVKAKISVSNTGKKRTPEMNEANRQRALAQPKRSAETIAKQKATWAAKRAAKPSSALS